MLTYFRKVFWWWMLQVKVSSRPGGIPLLFFHAAQGRTSLQVASLLADAIAVVDKESPEAGQLIRHDVRFVAARNTGATYTLPDVGGLVSSFADGETASPELMASQLIWTTVYFSELRRQRLQRAAADKTAAAQLAAERQRKFLAALPGGEKWLRYLGPFESARHSD